VSLEALDLDRQRFTLFAPVSPDAGAFFVPARRT